MELKEAFEHLREAAKEFGKCSFNIGPKMQNIGTDKCFWSVWLCLPDYTSFVCDGDTAAEAIAAAVERARQKKSVCPICGGKNHGEFAHVHGEAAK